MNQPLWIKITTAIWDDDKIKLIEAMPDRDVLLVCWFKLLTQAGKANAGGRVQLTEYIPLETSDLATIFNRPYEVVERALEVFKRFEMIELDAAGFIDLPNWSKHQNIDALEKIREQGRERVRKHREGKQKKQPPGGEPDGDSEPFAGGEPDNGGSNVTRNVTVTDKEKNREEIELEKNKDIKGNGPAKPDNTPTQLLHEIIPFETILNYFNDICGTNYKASSKQNKKWINARWNEGHRVDDFKRVIDNKYADWANDPDYCIYLRPETLFGNKFSGYLNQRPKGNTGGGGGGGNGGSSRASEDYAQFVIN